MKPIRKFVEALDFGGLGNRICYAVGMSALPPERPGARWQEEIGFDEATELMQSSGFQEVVQCARRSGFALVEIPR
jgi:hypothetical protein